MRYLSVCSGIEAASVAWHHLGWTPVGFSEIEPFPAAVLAHRFPNIPNYGDMTKHESWPITRGAIDLLVGGTPCQSFSVAGLRQGLADPRGNLMLTYLAIADRLRPRWLVWENVPGVLSSGRGRDFGTFLGSLGELGYGWAYRCLDAQHMRVGRWPRAVPQRRRRVFVVGCLGDWGAPGEVLALEEGLRRHLEAKSKKGKNSTSDAEGGSRGGCWPARVASTLNHAFGDKLGLEDQHALNGAPLFVPDVVGALTAKGPSGNGAPEVDAHHYIAQRGCWWDGSDCAGTLTKQNAGGGQRMPDKDNLGAVLQPTAYRWQNDRDGLQQDDAVAALRASQGASGFHEMNHPVIAQPVPFTKSKRAQSTTDDETWVDGQVNPTISLFDQGDTRATTVAVAFAENFHAISETNTAPSMTTSGYSTSQNAGGLGIASAMTVRRLTPRECERLQGFPDDWTMIPYRGKPPEQCPDGPRYKALGNSMACNCMSWIGERIAAYENHNP
jgi:DNA (cytosine-5)-methyltransferase 1